MIITPSQIMQKFGTFQTNDSIVIDSIYFKIFISFYKANITHFINYLMSFIIYKFVLKFFIKVYIIIKDEKILLTYFFKKLLKNNVAINLKRLADSLTNY